MWRCFTIKKARKIFDDTFEIFAGDPMDTSCVEEALKGVLDKTIMRLIGWSLWIWTTASAMKGKKHCRHPGRLGY
jgi:hypothetical protein